MIDQRTTHFNFALPHPSNQLTEDVARLRSALSGIDNMLNWTRQNLSSNDDSLTNVQAIVNAIRVILPQLNLISSAAETTLTYDGQGRVINVTEVLVDGVTTRATSYAYNPDGTLANSTVIIGDNTYITSYSYSNGLLISTVMTQL